MWQPTSRLACGSPNKEGVPVPVPGSRVRWGELHDGETIRMEAQALLDTLLTKRIREDGAVEILPNDAPW